MREEGSKPATRTRICSLQNLGYCTTSVGRCYGVGHRGLGLHDCIAGRVCTQEPPIEEKLDSTWCSAKLLQEQLRDPGCPPPAHDP